MAAALVPLSLQTLFDANGRVAFGAYLLFFATGTTDPITVYRDAGATAAFSRPVVVNAAGRVPPIYVTAPSYKVRILSKDSVLLDEIDGILGVPTEDVTPDPTPAATKLPVGFLSPAYADAIVPGFVRANGRTLGASGSGASEYAADDAQALFIHLWNIDENLTVTGGRGVSALADFQSNKRITLPDLRGRSFSGRDGMGNSQANRITAATISDPDVVGSSGGAQLIQLTEAQMPSHSHTGSTSTAAAHTHSATTDVQGSHTHQYPYATYSPDGGAATGTGPVRASQNTVEDTTQAAGAHSHNVIVDAGGAHSHTLNVAATGGDASHSNMPPAMLGTWYMSLGL